MRGAFFGEQAQRVQRDRDDIRVMIRMPLAERESLATLGFALRHPLATTVTGYGLLVASTLLIPFFGKQFFPPAERNQLLVDIQLPEGSLIERTRLGSYLRAGTENPKLVQAFGVNVPLMVMLTYGAGAGLAAVAGVLAAPVIQLTPLMGSNLIIIVFAVVVIGGMGSILGSIVTGFSLGIIEGLTKVFYPEGASVVIFVVMILTLAFRPNGLFGRAD